LACCCCTPKEKARGAFPGSFLPSSFPFRKLLVAACRPDDVASGDRDQLGQFSQIEIEINLVYTHADPFHRVLLMNNTIFFSEPLCLHDVCFHPSQGFRQIQRRKNIIYTTTVT